MSRNFYDVLHVDRSATLEEIKLAFKRRALQVHPDKGAKYIQICVFDCVRTFDLIMFAPYFSIFQ